jgi:serine/threonine protein kinase
MASLLNDKKFSEIEIRVIMEQLLLALDFFQQKKIVHRDIKPDNILINQIRDKGTRYDIKVADLGLALSTPKDEMLFKKCGTPGYIAPEIFTCEPTLGHGGYSYKADVFSAGCLFFNLLTGYYVFNGAKTQGESKEKQLYDIPVFETT